MLCIFSLPGESASRDRVVTRPYTTAQAAQTRATTTPWFVRKLLNRNPPRSDLRAARGSVARTFVARIARRERLPGANAGAVYRAGRRYACPRRLTAPLPSPTRHPQPAARLRRSGARAAHPAPAPARPPAGRRRRLPAPRSRRRAALGLSAGRGCARPRPRARRPSAAARARRAAARSPAGCCARGSPAARAPRRSRRAPARGRARRGGPRRSRSLAPGARRRAPMFSSDTAAWAIMSVLVMRLSSAS